MTIETDKDNVTDIQQLRKTVAELASSLEHSKKRNNKMQKILSVILFVFATSVTSLAITKGGLINDVYANTNAATSSNANAGNDMMQQLGPVLIDVGILVSRMKQDSDVIRARALMRTFPKKYPPGTRMDQITLEELNSFEASNALVVGTIAEEIKFINDSLRQMNFSILVMAHSMDTTMGRMGDFIP